MCTPRVTFVLGISDLVAPGIEYGQVRVRNGMRVMATSDPDAFLPGLAVEGTDM